MKVAAAQMNSGSSVSANLAVAEKLIAEAATAKCDLIAFPENFALMAEDKQALLSNAQKLSPKPTAIVRWICEQARKHKMWILAGSIPFAANKTHVTNTSLLVDTTGKIKSRYDKIHLFDVKLSADRVYEESKTVKAGSKPVTTVIKLKKESIKTGLTVCYDLRFPELYRKLSKAGADLIFIPSAFTKLTGQAHWDVLTRARAIENLAYVIAPGQTGSPYAGRETYGHTRIIDPWGHVVAELESGVGIVTADIDFKKLKKIRAELPALTHRRIS